VSGSGFLFGKLPGHGDFVTRGLTPARRGWWDAWFSATMDAARVRHGDGFAAAWAATPPHHVLVAPPEGADVGWCAGCVLASRDRVGRAFPLVLGWRTRARLDQAEATAIAARLAACAIAAPRDADALLAAAGHAARDPGAAGCATYALAPGRTDWIGAR
jgi:type VI secretion system ImpM family protein